MTENMKKLLEIISGETEEVREKLTDMSREELTAFAAEKGIVLTEADFEPRETESEVSLDEAEAVSGGDSCKCTVTGTGKKNEDYRDNKCKCVAVGWGHDDIGNGRCYCLGTGSGISCDWLGGVSPILKKF